mgnify:CR=1 FL=1
MDVYTSIPKESKHSALIKEFRILFLNLYCGIQLLAFRRHAIDRITVSYDQFILLLGFYTLTALVVSYAATPNPVFDLSGLGYLGVKLLIADGVTPTKRILSELQMMASDDFGQVMKLVGEETACSLLNYKP